MTNDLNYILRWWLVLFVIGTVSLPLITLLFKKFFDSGYGFAKTAGIVIVSYLVFLASTFKLLPFSSLTILIIGGLYTLINLYLLKRHKSFVIGSIHKNLKSLIFQEVFFTCGFVFWSIVRAHQPDLNGLEKFMDYGFINSILRSSSLPPADMWYSGGFINYYWFGHLTTAILTKLSGIPQGVTYNLMLATILGLTLTQTFSIVSTLVHSLSLKLTKLAVGAGIVSALLLNFAGNFHTPIYALKDGVDKYWYPDATRFIGYHPENNDKTIHEFPIYSYVVSDLHAHLLNLMFVVLYIGLMWRIVSKKRNFLDIAINGFLLGIMFMTNTWDFANYALLTGITLLLFNLHKKGISISAFLDTALVSATIAIVGLIVASPFIFYFKSIAQGIAFTDTHTPLWQLGVLWGFPGVLTVIFSLFLLRHKNFEKSDLFVMVLLLTGWVLIFIPEVIFVKDIYIATHHRANTMFKLTYQAFVMFYMSSGYITIRTLYSVRSKLLRAFLASLYAVIFASLLWYATFAIKSYYRDLKTYIGLNGETWLTTSHPYEYQAIEWLRKNVTDQPTILEAPGDSYTEYDVISAYSGLPTVSGWFVHEWLWRGSPSVPQERVNDITEIYTTASPQSTYSLLKKYNVSYVIVGSFEKTKYPNLNEEKLLSLGKLVFESPGLQIIKIN